MLSHAKTVVATAIGAFCKAYIMLRHDFKRRKANAFNRKIVLFFESGFICCFYFLSTRLNFKKLAHKQILKLPF